MRVHARSREWIALPSSSEDALVLRSLTGGPADTVMLDPSLEIEPVRPAHFELPPDARPTVAANASLLYDALRMTLRRGAGPFRSAGHLSFEPRSYQLVPLLMAMRLAVPRLLIADDVGIGKTIEAGLILRELLDRGEVEAFSVLCPPNLVEQWQGELKERFAIDATAITSTSASRLERKLPLSQSLFNAYPNTVVSLDYIKAEARRDNFAKTAPHFVIVDEAHTCVVTYKGVQQRFDLLKGLSANQDRAMLLLTATPHSGDESAFARLLSLLNADFETLEFDNKDYREWLARHFVQRRRVDLTEGEWDEGRAFPRHETSELPYHLDAAALSLQEATLDYCLERIAGVKVASQGEATCGNPAARSTRRMACWATLALLRCVGSSPAAVVSALRNRLGALSERIEDQIFDQDAQEEESGDLEPGAAFEADPPLQALINAATTLRDQGEAKLTALIGALRPLLAAGADPIVFCRFVATADYVAWSLRAAFPAAAENIRAVTGPFTFHALTAPRGGCIVRLARSPAPPSAHTVGHRLPLSRGSICNSSLTRWCTTTYVGTLRATSRGSVGSTSLGSPRRSCA